MVRHEYLKRKFTQKFSFFLFQRENDPDKLDYFSFKWYFTLYLRRSYGVFFLIWVPVIDMTFLWTAFLLAWFTNRLFFLG